MVTSSKSRMGPHDEIIEVASIKTIGKTNPTLSYNGAHMKPHEYLICAHEILALNCNHFYGIT